MKVLKPSSVEAAVKVYLTTYSFEDAHCNKLYFLKKHLRTAESESLIAQKNGRNRAWRVSGLLPPVPP